ncbi:butyrophilin subfamily 1 member A1-like [Ornithorhynchus anatinus]|uniref:butyrophilin subfamily 1 member A1-like n=1 Tax=Ornithorhynchus anatinus TaxID=9258 RepID=UPI0010A8ED41|nr:butyrophilin subfamily 1 member A1-like [Ornithorhynchus anatinus]
MCQSNKVNSNPVALLPQRGGAFSSSSSTCGVKRHFCLCWCLLNFLLLLSVQLGSGQFTVVGPTQPIVANFGEDAELLCQLDPKTDAEHMEIRWYRYNESNPLHMYPKRKDQEAELTPEFQERTMLVRNSITSGMVALRIPRVKISDTGNYMCQFISDKHFSEAVCELQVTSEGSTPTIHFEVLGTEEIRLWCRSSGWYPEPQVQWRDSTGETVSNSEPVMSRDEDGLYDAKVAFTLRKNTTRTVTCSILSQALKWKKESSVLVTDNLFSQISSGRWILAVSGILNVICLLSITALLWIIYRRKGYILNANSIHP